MARTKAKKEPKKWTENQAGAWMGLVRTKQLLIDKVEEELKRAGYPPLSWYDVLWELDQVDGGSLRLNDLGQRVLLNKYNVTRLVQRLEQEGYVSRNACHEDGRGIIACITNEGRKIRRKMWPVYERVVRENFLSKFDKNEIAELKNFIERIHSSRPEVGTT